MNTGLVKYNLEETIEDGYFCPLCGSEFSSGIREPEGDYDDWLVKPHCVECGFENDSNKHPFEYCTSQKGTVAKACSCGRMPWDIVSAYDSRVHTLRSIVCKECGHCE